MSRIVNESYFDKLNSALEGFDFSDNLKSLVDFFIEQVEKDQSRKGSRNQKLFSEKDFNFLQQLKESSEIKRVLSYLHKLINSFDGNYLQIHLNIDLEDAVSNQIIFLLTWDALINSSFDRCQICNDIKALESEINRDLILSSDNNKHRLNEKFREFKGKKYRKTFLQKLLNLTNQNDYGCGWLVNVNKGNSASFNISEYSHLPNAINSYLNFGDTLQVIYNNNSTILSRVDTIINLFPAITGSNIWYQDFIAESINEWNRLGEFNFKKVITITSGQKSLESLLDMQKQNKFQVEEIYIIYSFELEYEDYEN
jgi:hypothetical protein